MTQPKVRSILKHNTVYTSRSIERSPTFSDLPVLKKEKSAAFPALTQREHSPRLTFDLDVPTLLSKIDLLESPLSQPKSKETLTNSPGSSSPSKASLKLKLSPVLPKQNKPLSHSPSLKGSFAKTNQKDDDISNPSQSPIFSPISTKASSPTIEARLNLTKVRSLTLNMNSPATARASSMNLKTMEDSPLRQDTDTEKGLQTERPIEFAQTQTNLETPSQKSNVFRINIKQAPNEANDRGKEVNTARKKLLENEKERKKKVMHFGMNFPTKTVYVTSTSGKPKEKLQPDVPNLPPPRSSSQTTRKIELRQRKDRQSIGGTEKSGEKSIPLSREHSRPDENQRSPSRQSPTIYEIKKQMEEKTRIFGFEEFASASASPKRKQSTENLLRLKSFSPPKSSKNASPYIFETENEVESKPNNLFIQNRAQPVISLKTVEEESTTLKLKQSNRSNRSNSFVNSELGSPLNKSNSKAVPEMQLLRIPGLEESLSSDSEMEQQERNTRGASTDKKVFKESITQNLFELNTDNFFLNSKNYSSIGDIIKSARAANAHQEAEDNNAPVIISYLGGTLQIQPKFMETHGSMCFTELWSGRSKSTYKKIAKSTYGLLKKVNSAAEDALYRPEKALKKKNIQARLEANKNGDLSPSNKASELHRLGTISERPSIHRSIGSDTPKMKGFDTPKMKGFETPKIKGFDTPKMKIETPKMRGVVDAPVREIPESRSMKSLFSKQLSLIVP